MLAKQPKTEARDLSYGKVLELDFMEPALSPRYRALMLWSRSILAMAASKIPTYWAIRNSTILGPSFREWCGKWFQSKGNVPNVFMCAIPTPTTIHDVRPTLTNVMALYKADPSVSLVEVAIFDGPNAVGAYDQNKVATFASTNNNGTNGPQDLIEGSTNFSIGNFLSPSFQPVASLALNWGLCLALRFQFSKDNGRILFTAAGADFQG